MMKTMKLGFLLCWILLFPSPSLLMAQLFQWTDARGIIHFTDNLHSVPEPLRNSSQLIVRDAFPNGISFSEIPVPPSEPKAPEIVSPPQPEPPKAAPPVIIYSPQHFTVIVVNTIVRRPKESARSVFQPNFNDRRFIHPSVFDGGSRQYIQPELFPAKQR